VATASSACAGDANAQCSLGVCYEEGEGVGFSVEVYRGRRGCETLSERLGVPDRDGQHLAEAVASEGGRGDAALAAPEVALRSEHAVTEGPAERFVGVGFAIASVPFNEELLGVVGGGDEPGNDALRRRPDPVSDDATVSLARADRLGERVEGIARQVADERERSRFDGVPRGDFHARDAPAAREG
jgi:hypothetical protein